MKTNFPTAWNISTTIFNMENCLTQIEKDQKKCRILQEQVLPFTQRLKRLEQQRQALSRNVKQFQDKYLATSEQKSWLLAPQTKQKKKLNTIVQSLKKQNSRNQQKIQTLNLRVGEIGKLEIKKQISQRKQEFIKMRQFVFQNESDLLLRIGSYSVSKNKGLFDNYFSIAEVDQSKKLSSQIKNLGEVMCKLEMLKDIKKKITVKKHLEDELMVHEKKSPSDNVYEDQALARAEIMGEISELIHELDQARDRLRGKLVPTLARLQAVLQEIKRLDFQNQNNFLPEYQSSMAEKQFIFFTLAAQHQDLRICLRGLQKHLSRKLNTLQWKFDNCISLQTSKNTNQNNGQLSIKVEGVKNRAIDFIIRLKEVQKKIQTLQKIELIKSPEELLLF